MLVALVDVAPTGVGLPHLDELMRDRPAFAVGHAARDDNALAHGLGGMLDREVGLQRVDILVAEDGREELQELGIGRVRRVGRMAQLGAALRRIVERRRQLLAARPLVVDRVGVDLGADRGLVDGDRVKGPGRRDRELLGAAEACRHAPNVRPLGRRRRG